MVLRLTGQNSLVAEVVNLAGPNIREQAYSYCGFCIRASADDLVNIFPRPPHGNIPRSIGIDNIPSTRRGPVFYWVVWRPRLLLLR